MPIMRLEPGARAVLLGAGAVAPDQFLEDRHIVFGQRVEVHQLKLSGVKLTVG
jgi:hypothetical protein